MNLSDYDLVQLFERLSNIEQRLKVLEGDIKHLKPKDSYDVKGYHFHTGLTNENIYQK